MQPTCQPSNLLTIYAPQGEGAVQPVLSALGLAALAGYATSAWVLAWRCRQAPDAAAAADLTAGRPRTFRAPAVPTVPALALLANFTLMAQVPPFQKAFLRGWIFFNVAVWLVVV